MAKNMELPLENRYTNTLTYLNKMRATVKTDKQLADLIGCTGPHLGNCLSGRAKTLLAYELAAEALWKRAHGETYVLISGPEHSIETIKNVVAANNGKFIPIAA